MFSFDGSFDYSSIDELDHRRFSMDPTPYISNGWDTRPTPPPSQKNVSKEVSSYTHRKPSIKSSTPTPSTALVTSVPTIEEINSYLGGHVPFKSKKTPSGTSLKMVSAPSPDNAKKELDHVLTNVLGLIPNDRLHVGINEHLRQHFRAIRTNAENMNCERWLLSLHHREDKLRDFEFKFKEKVETLNESEIELILQLRDCVNHCWENDINMNVPCPMLLDTKEDFDNFRGVTFL